MIGLVAGAGRFPLILAQAARNHGYQVLAVAIKEEADKSISKVSDKLIWLSVGELDRIVNTFLEEKISEVFMAGKIKKTIMYTDIKLDERLQKLLNNLKNRNDDVILGAFVSELTRQGINVRNSAELIPDMMAGEGVLTREKPDEGVLEDIRYGFKMAKLVAGLDIGQTVVVKKKAVLAVEAIEGTDSAILRGGELARGGIIVAKVARPNQDMRFDIPVIGIKTIETLIEARAEAMVVEAGKTLILDKKEFLELAEEHRIIIMGLKSAEDPV
ncbi:MAG: UDP-2,3-diacylglucosamine diphosphatase LpxI [Candidatus Wallbacteria bacterium]|nr:UDP-2,3-diacylglucosamine diphosphatase LpxI [Candidatus Wallbacteria bacterium]